MRAILLVVIVVVVALIIAVATGFLNINQVRGVQPPEVTATGNGVTAKGGQAPAFDVETGSIKVGTKDANVQVPTVEVARPAQNQAETANNAQ